MKLAARASVQPEVTVTWASGSIVRPVPVVNRSAMVRPSSGMPNIRAYWP